MKLGPLIVAIKLLLLVIPAQGQVSSARMKARVLYARLTSVTLPLDAPELVQMEALIAAGKTFDAAKLATDKDEFYNIVVRNMATEMSNRDLKVAYDFNDFVATFIGNVRDKLSAKELLTGDYVFIGDVSLLQPNFPIDWADYMLKSNNHYRALDGFSVPGYTGTFNPTARANFRKVLKKVKQQIMNNSGAAVDNPEPAGLLTTRAWAEAHLNMGTNRRAVQFTISQFLCRPLDNSIADQSGPEDRISHDVTRTPQGDPNKFNECRGCHTALDYMRPAFLNFDFFDVDNGRFLRNVNKLDPLEEERTDRFPAANETKVRIVNGRKIPVKYFSNETVASQTERQNFPSRSVKDDSWQNNLTNASNQAIFGWRGALSGKGLRSYAEMISNAKAYSGCFVERVFKAVCGRAIDAGTEAALKQALADNFEANNYRIKGLFEQVAARPECLGN